MISIQYSQIPAYLQKGAFYRNLIDSDGDEEIQIPEICYSPDDTVDSLEKLQSTLQIAAFWLLDTIPTGVIKYCYENDFRSWYDAIVSKFGQKVQQFGPFAHKEDIELAFVHTLCSIFNSNSYHHAFQQAVEKNVDEVVDFLIQNSDGNKTVECARAAAYSGRLDILKRLQQNGFPWSGSACQAAAAKGHLDCLQYFHENGCPWEDEVYMDASEISCVQYAFEQGLPWHPAVAVALAKRGSVECLQYAIDHGCVLDKAAVKGAARNGHVSTLKLLHDHGCEWDNDVYFEATGDRAHFNIVKYAFENHLEWHPDTCERLAGKNRLEILKYTVERDCPLTAHAATLCATHGYAECLRCLLEADCPLDADVCKRTCMSGKFECLQLLVQHGGVCDLATARAAAQYQRWDCLKYLCEQGCLVDHTIPLEAVKNGEVDALRCAMDNGCTYSDDIVFEAAASERNAYASLKYLIDDQGLALNQDGSSFVAAFARGDFECVQYLMDVGYDVSTCGANLWQPYLLEHVKYTHYYKQLMDKLDKGLLKCIEYAVTHAWNIQTCGILLLKHVQTYPDKYPLCHAYLQSESFYQC